MMEVIIHKDIFLQTWVRAITPVRDIATCYQPEDRVMTEASTCLKLKKEEMRCVAHPA